MSEKISLKEFNEAFKEMTLTTPDVNEKVIKGQEILKGLLKNEDILLENLIQVALRSTPETFLPTDVNGISLYRDPEKNFSLHLFIWDILPPYPIHDHGSWGVVGCYKGRLSETKWSYDTKVDDNTVILHPSSKAVLKEGETTFVYEGQNGLHSMKALDNNIALSIHAYGMATRKGFLNMYHPIDMKAGKFVIYKGYPILSYRRLLAAEAIAAINPDIAKDTIKKLSEDLSFSLINEIKKIK